jgi:hypothetical protein
MKVDVENKMLKIEAVKSIIKPVEKHGKCNQ